MPGDADADQRAKARLQDHGSGIELADWPAVAEALVGRGWIRLQGAVGASICDQLADAAARAWSPVPNTEGGGHVRQGGLASHEEIDLAAPVVRSFAQSIRDAINRALPRSVTHLPAFNHAEWATTTADGIGFITPHRDPPGAAGVIAITTLRGSARFRVWDDDNTDLPPRQHLRAASHHWDTCDGDLVILRGGGWPAGEARCPVHEVESPATGDRMTLTLRHNRRGYGGDYFA